jgi:FkbM family methyltransferase
MKKNTKKIVIFSGKTTLCLVAILLCMQIIILHISGMEPSDKLYSLHKTNRMLWMALINNDYISERIKVNGVWEPHVTNYLVKNVKPNETVIELGANIGYHTALMAKSVSPGGRIYAYEANSAVYDLAKFSLRMNDLSDIVEMKNIGISDKTGEAFLHCDRPDNLSLLRTNIGTAHITLAEGQSNNNSAKKIKVTSLDEDLPDLKNVDWLRMDIEGSELLAIHGAKRIIESSPNIKIVMEWAPFMLENFGNVSDFIDLLHNYGFTFYNIEDNGDLGDVMSKAELLKKNNLMDLVLIRNRENKRSSAAEQPGISPK